MGALQTAFDFGGSAETLESVEQRLARLLGDELGTPISLTWTDNARVMVSARKRGSLTRVRLHHMFTDADEGTVRAVARFLVEGQGEASQDLRRFIADKRDRIAGAGVTRPSRRSRVRMRGRSAARPRRVRRARRLRQTAAVATRVGAREPHHDLQAILRDVNARYFEPAIEACIGWAREGQRVGRRVKRRSIKLGSYLGDGRSIRIHPVLDASWVPRFFVEYIVYHELLHDALGMPVRNGRRNLHGPEFRARERMFERYVEAIAWERDNLDRLLSG